eukprot:4248897-Pleurochrysis_carterae.AAC.2
MNIAQYFHMLEIHSLHAITARPAKSINTPAVHAKYEASKADHATSLNDATNCTKTLIAKEWCSLGICCTLRHWHRRARAHLGHYHIESATGGLNSFMVTADLLVRCARRAADLEVRAACIRCAVVRCAAPSKCSSLGPHSRVPNYPHKFIVDDGRSSVQGPCAKYLYQHFAQSLAVRSASGAAHSAVNPICIHVLLDEPGTAF